MGWLSALWSCLKYLKPWKSFCFLSSVFHCLVFFFPTMRYITPKQNHYWKQESPVKSHNFLSLAVTWGGVSGSCICSVVWSREVLPHPGLETTKQPTSDFQTLKVWRFSWTDTLSLSRQNGSGTLSNCASNSNISLSLSLMMFIHSSAASSVWGCLSFLGF